MIWALYISTGLVLFILAVQDWKRREVSVVLLALLSGLTISMRLQHVSIQEWLEASTANLFLLGMQLAVVWAYFQIRRPNKKQRLFQLLGLGDVVFIAVMAVGMPTLIFLLLLISGCVVSIFSHLLVTRLLSQIDRGVPLITYWFPVTCLFLFTENLGKLSSSINLLVHG